MLHVSLPFLADRNEQGELKIDLLDPEDRSVASVSRRISARAGNGLPEQNMTIAGRLSTDDLVWHRLRYRFIYSGDAKPAFEGVSSISQILRHPVVHVLDQQAFLAGSPAAIRVIVTGPDNDAPIESGTLKIDLTPPGQKTQTLYAGRLDSHGTSRAEFRFPAGVTGTIPLRFAVDTEIGEADFTQDVRVEDKGSILLTTEKPVYQPGQTIHLRALALDRASHQAMSGRDLTFEAEDARGNKIFRRKTQTDEYGVASAELTLAEEVNLGTWHLRARVDSNDAAKTENEIAVQVERYVLPRFKVDLDLGGNQPKHGYRPGDHVTGVVRSNYFFGKPVDHAETIVTASAKDVQVFEAGQAKGATDAEGAFRFDIRLPDFLTGHPLAQGAAVVMIEAAVKDGAGHTETHALPITVSESPLLVTAVPESGALAPGLNNQVFLLASYPDGTPAQAQLRISGDGVTGETVTSDKSGVAVIQVPGTTANLHVDVNDSEGNRASLPLKLAIRPGAEQVLLRTDHALYRAGDQVRLQVFSTKQRGSAYVDAIRNGQTVGTWDLDIENGRADLAVPVTAAMAGAMDFHAYLFGHDGQPLGDHRIVFVQPADDLRIEATSDASVYKPGAEARVAFRVTNAKGEGVQAALGVEVVDQAVFALAEKRPGFAKVFFYLEQEAMKPRYEIHSIGLPDVILTHAPGEWEQQNRAAMVLLAAVAEPVGSAPLEFGRDVLHAKADEYQERYRTQLSAALDRATDGLGNGGVAEADACTVDAAASLLTRTGVRDPWGNAMRVELVSWYPRKLNARSAGPDGKFNDNDDIPVPLNTFWCSPAGYTNSIGIRVLRQQGNKDGFADVLGTVVDSEGAAVAGAKIRLIERANNRIHSLSADRAGRFSLTSLTTGRYTLQVTGSGFGIAVKDFNLDDRDRATFQVTLQPGMAVGALMVNGGLGFGAGAGGGIALAAVPAAAALPRNMVMKAESGGGGRGGAAPRTFLPPAAPDTHVRSWFPESLFVAPEIITDRDGRASITIPIADSITSWRMAMLASTKTGALGSGSSSLKVFQDFFTEMDLPVTLTQGDEISIPVAIYNYTGSRGEARIGLDKADWFSESDDAAQNVSVEAGRVGSVQFPITAKRIGHFKLTLRAELAGESKRADIVVREIDVVPNGREQNVAFNGRLDSSIRRTVDFPAATIPDSQTIFVRLYPGPLSQVVEGMDSLLRMPYGCFEQTSSSTYPNILALSYMKRTKKVTPEIAAKAEGYIASGYQRLVTFEVPGGGFSWFGQAPANKILTSYGLMEFSDMSKVHDVDPKLIQRTQQWLASQQRPDGSWSPDTSFINEGATNRFNTDVLRITAYVAWALENTGYAGPAVGNAKRFLEDRLRTASKPDPYTLAVLGNFAADGKDAAFTDDVMQQLLDARSEEGDKVWWSASETSMYATGVSASVETTGLAVQALLKSGRDSAAAAKGLNYIVSKKDSAGTWGSTQATIVALRSLLLSEEKGGATANGTVEVLLNGNPVEHLTLNAENNDLLHQFVFPAARLQEGNEVEVRFHGQGSMAYQVAGRYFTPWGDIPTREPLTIDVKYDRTTLATNQIATATATVRNNLPGSANMVMVDLGIPPGFDLLTEDLDSYREKPASRSGGHLEKYSITATQAILYFDSIPANGRLSLTYRLRAKYPVRARTFQARVYEYYTPDIGSTAAPVQLVVR
ncbi:MAG TPA: MG2 domain-containing protein [Bryobacteraceae bacterium]|nr:MG2 domain-containing protein [Bryobacteraceae bacterium]